jgi:hypothetical protein
MASPNLTAISKVAKLSPNIISILGCNPGKMTLRGTNTYIIGNGKRYISMLKLQNISEKFMDYVRHGKIQRQ